MITFAKAIQSNKIEQVKAELASARQKYDECILNPVNDYSYDWDGKGSQADRCYEEIREKLEEYVVLLETEAESLRDKLSAYRTTLYGTTTGLDVQPAE